MPLPLPSLDDTTPRPFLKWAGGKTQLLPRIQPLLPRRLKRYFEPFAGGAALFFHLRPRRALLSDINAELVDCYLAVRDSVEDLIEALKRHRYDEEHYYAVRDLDPRELPLVERAARTIFLNRTGFNGLYRVNRAGNFNVPFGRFLKPNFCDEKNLRACSAALRGADLRVRDFTAVRDLADRGDFVYFDPPYAPLSDTADFTSYVPGGFGWDQQERLSELFTELADRGVNVMLSNSSVPRVRDLYRGFQIVDVEAKRSINSRPNRRGTKAQEIVVRCVSG
ncbi:MAG: DNA adenine methylase [Polyangiaceae bacterium]|nr:DNA adenine methylase [Polyangiaceae bacterium]